MGPLLVDRHPCIARFLVAAFDGRPRHPVCNFLMAGIARVGVPSVIERLTIDVLCGTRQVMAHTRRQFLIGSVRQGNDSFKFKRIVA